MSDLFQNESQATREGLMNALKALSDQPIGNFVNVSGDTMTGNLEVPTAVVTGAATIAGPAQFVNEIRGATMNLSGAATLTGPTQFTNELLATTLNLSGAATLSSTVNVIGIMSSVGAVTLNPAIIAQQSVLGGATIAPVRIIASTASQAFFDFRGAVLSTASLNLAASTLAGVIQVWINGAGGPNIGYMPIFKGVL